LPRRRNAASNKLDDWRSHLGRKVSIRFRLHDDPAHPFSEAIGVVRAVRGEQAAEQIEILTRRGEVATVAVADIVASKLFD
jgi:hypothetical protein